MSANLQGREVSKALSPHWNKTIIRQAAIKDVITIHNLLSYYADEGLLLPRSLSELYDHLRDFFIMESPSLPPSVIGVCALGICWEDLAEIRSLAVSEAYQGKGAGFRLVEACLKDAGPIGVTQVFTLTYIPNFFFKLGFREVNKASLPHKIWADCLKCHKFPDCDETAMLLKL